VHRRRQRCPHLRLGNLQVVGVHLGPVDAHGQADRLPVQARERPDDRRGCRAAVEHLPGPTRDDRWSQAVQHDRRLAVGGIHGALDAVEPVAQRRVVHLGRRRHVCPEEAQVEPAKAAQRAEALSLAAHRVDGRHPVDLDAQAAGLEPPHMRAHTEAHRHGRERLGPRLEHALGLLRSLATHVDAGDPHSARDAARAAGKRQAEHDCGESGDRGEDPGPLPEDAALGARSGAASRPDQQRSTPGGQDAPV
jgi:hypothetical protein